MKKVTIAVLAVFSLFVFFKPAYLVGFFSMLLAPVLLCGLVWMIWARAKSQYSLVRQMDKRRRWKFLMLF